MCTACVNRIRGLLAEFGLVLAELDALIQWCDERIAAHLKQNEQVRQAEQLKGVGPVTASAVVATVGDFKQFKDAHSLEHGWG